MTTAIVPRPPSALQVEARVTSAQVRAQLAVARERARQKLEAIEQRFKGVGDWRGFVRRHPVLTLGAAFVTGYALAKLFTRR